jgi:predicted nicotinamide N-methyase
MNEMKQVIKERGRMLIIHSMHRHSLEKKRFFLAQKCTFPNPRRLEYFHEAAKGNC